MLNDSTTFQGNAMNGWKLRLPEYADAAQKKPNWYFSNKYGNLPLGAEALIIPTQLVDNAGSVLTKAFNLVAGNEYQFSVHMRRVNDSPPYPQISLRIGDSEADKNTDKIICSGTPENSNTGTTLIGKFIAESTNVYLKVFNSETSGMGNDFCLFTINVIETKDNALTVASGPAKQPDCCGTCHYHHYHGGTHQHHHGGTHHHYGDGSTGNHGNNGPTGSHTTHGDTGPTGSHSAHGNTGPTGSHTAHGNTGPTGSHTAHGDTGPGPNGDHNDSGDTTLWPITTIPARSQFAVTLINNEEWERTATINIDGKDTNLKVSGNKTVTKQYETTTGKVTIALFDSQHGAMRIPVNIVPAGHSLAFGAEKPSDEKRPNYRDVYVHIDWTTSIK